MIAAIIQARIASTRFPGKTLEQILGKPMLWHIVNRLRTSKTIEKLIIVTPKAQVDDPIETFAKENGIDLFRGSETDVLDLFYQAAKRFGADVIARITADDPFKDPNVIDKAINIFLKGQPELDYVANCSYDGSIAPTYPEGIDIEVLSFHCLENIWKNASKPSEREHVTPYLFSNKDKYKIKGFYYEKDLSGLRWTVDYERDFLFASEIYKRLFPEKGVFLMQDILDLLDKEPVLAMINSGTERHEGYHKSVKAENK
jgi:spore coat polysaccharide biosynthesis protein SpsF